MSVSRRQFCRRLGGSGLLAGVASRSEINVPFLPQAGTPPAASRSDIGSLYSFVQQQADRLPLELSFLRPEFRDLASWQARVPATVLLVINGARDALFFPDGVRGAHRSSRTRASYRRQRWWSAAAAFRKHASSCYRTANREPRHVSHFQRLRELVAGSWELEARQCTFMTALNNTRKVPNG